MDILIRHRFALLALPAGQYARVEVPDFSTPNERKKVYNALHKSYIELALYTGDADGNPYREALNPSPVASVYKARRNDKKITLDTRLKKEIDQAGFDEEQSKLLGELIGKPFID